MGNHFEVHARRRSSFMFRPLLGELSGILEISPRRRLSISPGLMQRAAAAALKAPEHRDRMHFTSTFVAHLLARLACGHHDH